MAEVSQDGGGGGHKKGGKNKQKKKSTRIDMTAMVDVAFLLLTFFILTTTLADTRAIDLKKPPKTDNEQEQNDLEQEVKGSKVMTIMLLSDDRLFYFVGSQEEDNVKPIAVDYGGGDNGIRKKMQEHLEKFKGQKPLCVDLPEDQRKGADCWDPIFVVKTGPNLSFKNVVDIVDELGIVDAPKQALTEMKPADSTFLAKNNIRF